MQKNIDLHPLLIKQLSKLGLNTHQVPDDEKNWMDFLEKTSGSYYDAEQERYLLERSLEISSREMQELNERLLEAQNLAHLGYWSYDRSANKMLWSPVIYELFGIDPSNEVPPLDAVMNAVDSNDRDTLKTLIERAFAEGKEYEMECRVKNALNNKQYWLYIVGRPTIEKNNVIKSISGIVLDITQKKNAEVKMKKLHQQLINAARQAGMSEVATSVLHNIGNVINSVNISIALLKENIEKIDCDNLEKAVIMIKTNLYSPHYLTEDAKGKLLPTYLESFTNNLVAAHKTINKEIKNLDVNITHIKDIVLLQKDLSGISGVAEMITLPDVADTALTMCFTDTIQSEITINKNYLFTQALLIDKTRLLQVLVNLIRNAKESLLTSDAPNKHIDIIIKKLPVSDEINIVIKDNGIGIPSDKLIQVFSFGYTTKKEGHGFGLHSSAIAIHEIGGKIKVDSDGPKKGAAFTITLPFSPPQENLRENP